MFAFIAYTSQRMINAPIAYAGVRGRLRRGGRDGAPTDGAFSVLSGALVLVMEISSRGGVDGSLLVIE